MIVLHIYIYIKNLILLFFILDIIGVLTNVHQIEEINVQDRPVTKRISRKF